MSAVHLTPMEQRLLRYFLARPGQLCTRAELLAQVWHMPTAVQTRTLDVHVAQLRRKLGLEENLTVRYKQGYLYTSCPPAKAAWLAALAAGKPPETNP